MSRPRNSRRVAGVGFRSIAVISWALNASIPWGGRRPWLAPFPPPSVASYQTTYGGNAHHQEEDDRADYWRNDQALAW